jgi:hypothetical protein
VLKLRVNHGFVDAVGKDTVFADADATISTEGSGSLLFERV